LKSALEAFSAAGQAFAEVGDIRGHALQIGSAAIVTERLGEYEQALDLYTAARDLSRDGQLHDAQAQNELKLGTLLMDHLDRTQEARTHLVEAVRLYRELGDAGLLSEALLRLGTVDGALGDTESAETCLGESRSLAEQSGDVGHAVDTLRELAGLRARRGDIGGAVERGLEAVCSSKGSATGPSSGTSSCHWRECAVHSMSSTKP
jgi:tetratricopeptide (TPR) repeat protein